MSICTLNLSIAVFEINFADYFIVKDKKIDGAFGRPLDRFLAGKDERRCLLKIN